MDVYTTATMSWVEEINANYAFLDGLCRFSLSRNANWNECQEWPCLLADADTTRKVMD